MYTFAGTIKEKGLQGGKVVTTAALQHEGLGLDCRPGTSLWNLHVLRVLQLPFTLQTHAREVKCTL